ncbi:hypothetical protein [Deinococcus phoenicis]|uniref:hypothetical protein n=1 Tax=Deinococcus phoenicis TaxID=1476583 RepID=UPI0012693451|nr:hypothetical protein [Deinococcus phoenicis]
MVDVDPIGKFAEFAGLFQAGQVHQQFQPGALVGLVSPQVLQRLVSVLAQHPAQLPGVPGRVVEKAAEGGGGFAGGAFWKRSAGTIQEQIEDDLERFPMLLAGEAGQDVRIEPSGTLFFGFTPHYGAKSAFQTPFSLYTIVRS